MRTVTQHEPDEQPEAKKPEGWLHVRIDRDVRKQVNVLAAQEEMSVPKLVEKAIKEYVEKRRAA